MLNFISNIITRLSYLLLPVTVTAIFLLLSSIQLNVDKDGYRLDSQTIADSFDGQIEQINASINDEYGMPILVKNTPDFNIDETRRILQKCCSQSNDTGRLKNALFKLDRISGSAKPEKISYKPVKLKSSR